MALMRLNIFSEALARNATVNVILPQNTSRAPSACRPPLPALYLLHGLCDDQDSWLRLTSIERYVQNRNLAVIMPSTDRGFYTDTAYGVKYFTYISEELPRVLTQWLPLSSRREDTFAAGMSMGGYGALKLGLRSPERFAAVASLSGAPMSKYMLSWRMGQKENDPLLEEFRATFGSEIAPENDIFSLLERAAPSPDKPRIFVCCGDEDFMFSLSERLRDEAERLGYDVTWTPDPGAAHDWGYWDRKIRDVLEWLDQSACATRQ